MRTYWSKEIAGLIGISPNTLRKWSISLENAGYSFIRDDNNNRAYTDPDILAFRKMKELLDGKMPMDNVVLVVASMHKQEQITPVVLGESRSDDRYQALANKFDEYVQQQTEFQQALLIELKKRDEYIEDALRTRDEHLTKTMNEVLETRRLIAAAQEDQQQQKKPWWMFWK